MSEETTFSEQSIADELGVTREEIATVRKSELYEKDHFVKRGREILLTKLGMDKLLSIIGRPKTAQEQSTPSTPTPNEPKPELQALANADDPYTTRLKAELQKKLAAGFVVAKVTKVFPKGRIMYGVVGITPVRIVVRDPKNFIAGMLIPVRHAHDEVYAFEGPLPRRKGRLIA